MATAKKAKAAAKPAGKKSVKSAKAAKAAKAAKGAKAPTRKASAKSPAAPMKPIKTSFNKTSLAAHLAETTGVEPRGVKAVMAALESTMLASVSRKGASGFVLPGLLKVTAVAVPAKKARKGINPFTKEETIFKAKPASVKLKVRPLKKLKDAAA